MDALSDLTPLEWRELQALMLEARHRRPAPIVERRLRELLAQRDRRAAQMPWDDLVQFGLVALGGYFMAKALS